MPQAAPPPTLLHYAAAVSSWLATAGGATLHYYTTQPCAKLGALLAKQTQQAQLRSSSHCKCIASRRLVQLGQCRPRSNTSEKFAMFHSLAPNLNFGGAHCTALQLPNSRAPIPSVLIRFEGTHRTRVTRGWRRVGSCRQLASECICLCHRDRNHAKRTNTPVTATMGRRQPLHSMWLLACIVLAAVHGARLAAAQQTIAFSWTDATKIAEAPSAPTLPPEGCSCLGTASCVQTLPASLHTTTQAAHTSCCCCCCCDCPCHHTHTHTDPAQSLSVPVCAIETLALAIKTAAVMLR